MKKNHLDILQCIMCSLSNLKLFSIKELNEEVIEGFISCQHCDFKYPITHGIPCFLPPNIRDETLNLSIKEMVERYREKEVSV